MVQLIPGSMEVTGLDLIQGVHGIALCSLAARGRIGDFLRHVKHTADIP